MRVRLRDGKAGFFTEQFEVVRKVHRTPSFQPADLLCFEMVALSFFASFGTYAQWLEGFSLYCIEKYNKASLANKTT